jgi:hypothetical protein
MAQVFRCDRCRIVERKECTGTKFAQASTVRVDRSNQSTQSATRIFELCGDCSNDVERLLTTAPPREERT